MPKPVKLSSCQAVELRASLKSLVSLALTSKVHLEYKFPHHLGKPTPNSLPCVNPSSEPVCNLAYLKLVELPEIISTGNL